MSETQLPIAVFPPRVHLCSALQQCNGKVRPARQRLDLQRRTTVIKLLSPRLLRMDFHRLHHNQGLHSKHSKRQLKLILLLEVHGLITCIAVAFPTTGCGIKTGDRAASTGE